MALKLFYGTLTMAGPDASVLEGATLVEEVRTAPEYRLFSVDDFPALIEDVENGVSIDAQVWEVPDDVWTEILRDEPPEYEDAPVVLTDGRRVDSLLASVAYVSAKGALDVSGHGSWRAYQATKRG